MKTQQQRDALHLAIIEDFSNVIAKHLELFTEEAIYQLTDPALNCECGYQH